MHMCVSGAEAKTSNGMWQVNGEGGFPALLVCVSLVSASNGWAGIRRGINFLSFVNRDTGVQNIRPLLFSRKTG